MTKDDPIHEPPREANCPQCHWPIVAVMNQGKPTWLCYCGLRLDRPHEPRREFHVSVLHEPAKT